MSTNTQGGWASKGVVDGKEEAEHLRKYYTVQHKLTFPIALWEGEKKPTEDGGMVPEKNPTWENYGVFSYPQVVLVDTKGIIRQVLPTFTRDDEERVATKLRQLLKEAGIELKTNP
jgi:hypothetical protein